MSGSIGANPSGDLLDVYIEEIGRGPVFRPEDQKQLARRMRDPSVPAGERARAREQLIACNLRFAFSIAKQFRNRGLDLSDLVAEANAGLVHAADKYDPDVGVNFISYAVWWIRQAIFAALAKHGRPVRLPLSRAADLSRLARGRAMLADRLGREPTDEELGYVVGVAPDVVRDLTAAAAPSQSLDEPVRDGWGGGGEDVLGNRIRIDGGDGDAEAITSSLEAESRRNALLKALEALPPRDRKVLVLYYGLEDGRARTLHEIADMMGVTRERIRQIRERALQAVREGKAAALLSDDWAA